MSSSGGRSSSRILIAIISLLGVSSFLYPFFLPALAGVGGQAGRAGLEAQPVSYTHLTLPTSDLV